MQVTINLNDEQLDRLKSVMRFYNITHEEAILMLISTQPKESILKQYKDVFVTDQSR